MGSRAETRQVEGVRQIVGFGEAQGLEVHHGRDEGDAVEGDTAVDEVTGQTGGAGGAIALAGEVEGRGPAFVAREVEADEFANGFEIGFQAPVLLVIGGSVAREKPVPTGSMKTRSPRSSQVWALSMRR